MDRTVHIPLNMLEHMDRMVHIWINFPEDRRKLENPKVRRKTKKTFKWPYLQFSRNENPNCGQNPHKSKQEQKIENWLRATKVDFVAVSLLHYACSPSRMQDQ